MVELMSPVGSFESLQAAIKAGADSVYFGIEHLHMRANSTNSFKISDLKKIVKICKEKNIKTYLTINTIIYDHDLILMKKICDEAKKANITAIIASDVAVMQYANSINLEVHLSTQVNISNIESLKFYSQFSNVVVLARELTLPQIKEIIKEINNQQIKGPNGELIKIEIFVHGALCVSISGKCYMSLAQYNSSANRGVCLQACRRAYKVIDEETGDELKIENKYVMSPKDLCTISFIDKLINAGISIFKIEGRGRSPDYVYTVTKVYKEAIQAVKNNTYTKEKINFWEEELKTVYNRGFWKGGYYLGRKLGEWSNAYGSKSTKTKTFVGKIKNYYQKLNVAELILETNKIKQGDEILITGVTTGVVKFKIKKILKDNKEIKLAKKLDHITFEVPEKVRENDKVYVITDAKTINE